MNYTDEIISISNEHAESDNTFAYDNNYEDHNVNQNFRFERGENSAK